jgi:nitrous oxidase accessory protein NosD
MKSFFSLPFLPIVTAVLFAAVVLSNLAAVPGPGASPTLPGARSRINAAEYTSIQAALDAVPEEGGMVVLPPGKFEITQPLRITGSDVTLVGSGSATELVNVNETGEPTILLASAELGDPQTDSKHDLWRIRIADLRLTGNAKSGSGIVAQRINEIFIQGVTVSYHGGDGIQLDHCYEDPRIADSLITYNKATGLALIGCHDIIVSANQFEENHDALHCFDSFNLTMTGNNLDDHLGHGVVIENTYGSVVSGNMIEECAGDAIVLDRDCYGTALSANVIAHNGGGIRLLDAHGIAVSANAVTIMKTDALHISAQASRIAVTGNSFSNSFIGDGQVRRRPDDLLAAGLRIDGGTGVTFSGNTLSGLAATPIAIGDGMTGRMLFDGNSETDSISTPDALRRLGATEDNLQIPSKVKP